MIRLGTDYAEEKIYVKSRVCYFPANLSLKLAFIPSRCYCGVKAEVIMA
jgi:hypothetical protein